MIYPQPLQAGDKVAIVATARKVSEAELNFAIALLRSWQLQPVIGRSIGVEDCQFAGDDKTRAADLQTQLDHPDIKAIWCARGGYGTVRIIDTLDFSQFKKHPKWIIGYSDVTALHAIVQKHGIASLHAEMPALIAKKSAETTATLQACLFGKLPTYSWQPSALNRHGVAEGELIGGNLSVLYSLCGSNTVADMAGKILFLEDLDEYLYHIDRMMQNLYRNGWLNHLAGLLIGGMSSMHDNSISFGKSAEEIILDRVKAYDFPVSFGCPTGHLNTNKALILGRKVRLEITDSSSNLQFV